MLSIQTPKIPDRAFYEDEIGMDRNFVYIDYYKFRQELIVSQALYTSCVEQVRDLISLYSYGRINEITRDNVVTVLCNYLGLERKDLEYRGSISLDATRKIEPLLERFKSGYWKTQYRGDAIVKFLTMYLEYRKAKNYSESVASIYKTLQDCDEVGNNGQPLKKVFFSYERRATGRHYTNSENLQGWNKRLLHCITAPKGHFLMWCDFEQIDLRVAYNLILSEGNEELTKMFDDIADKYEAFARIISKSINEKFDKELFTANRKRYKMSVLSAVYGSGLGTLIKKIGNRQLAEALDTYVSSNLGYKRYKSMIERVIDFGVELKLVDYFGNERTIGIPTEAATNSMTHQRLLNQGLNTPVQSTSYSIVIEWCNAIFSRLRNLGVSHDQASITLIRHDEGVFMFSNECKKYFSILADTMRIAIDDWSVLDLEPELGYNYTVPDEDLMAEFKHTMDTALVSLTPRTVSSPRSEKYYPVGDILTGWMYNPCDLTTFFKTVIMTNDPDYPLWTAEIQNADSSQWNSITAKYFKKQTESDGDSYTKYRCLQFLECQSRIFLVNKYDNKVICLRNVGEVKQYAGHSNCIEINNVMVSTLSNYDSINMKFNQVPVSDFMEEYNKLKELCKENYEWYELEA